MIENRVQKSGLTTIDLQEFLPETDGIVDFDIAAFLFQGLILREKDFRTALKETDWTLYDQKIVMVFCSADAIIPDWAYMLVASHLIDYAADMFYGDQKMYVKSFLLQNLRNMDIKPYIDARVIIKGCGSEEIDAAAYFEVSKKLLPVVKTLMYGEPCSTVPIFKQKKTN